MYLTYDKYMWYDDAESRWYDENRDYSREAGPYIPVLVLDSILFWNGRIILKSHVRVRRQENIL